MIVRIIFIASKIYTSTVIKYAYIEEIIIELYMGNVHVDKCNNILK